jgi:hypothetical protein
LARSRGGDDVGLGALKDNGGDGPLAFGCDLELGQTPGPKRGNAVEQISNLLESSEEIGLQVGFHRDERMREILCRREVEVRVLKALERVKPRRRG